MPKVLWKLFIDFENSWGEPLKPLSLFFLYDRWSISMVSAIAILTSVLILIKFLIYILLWSSTKMVWTRSQLENLSKEELIEELITVDDITSKISDLTNRFDDFLRRFEVVSSDLAITKNCNRLLTERVIQLERNAVTNAQYHRWESVEVNPIPPSISDEELELNICEALSLTGHEVKPNDLQVCHHLKKKESVIVKFKWMKLKQKVLVNRKNLWNKSEDLCLLKFSGKLFISGSMCHENHQLAYKCRQLMNAGKIHSTWFWNNAVV